MLYLGFATVDKRLSSPMLPWIIAEIKKAGTKREVSVGLGRSCLELEGEGGWKTSHQLSLISRLGVFPDSGGDVTAGCEEGGCLVWVLRDQEHPLLYCHLLHSSDLHELLELMASIKEQQASKKGAGSVSLCPDISPSSSHFFEVLYIGRVKVSHKKVPDSFIDEALDRFKICQERQRRERGSQEEERLLNGLSSKSSIAYSSTEALETSVAEKTEDVPAPTEGRKRSGSLGTELLADNQTQKESFGTQEHNRTMVFHVGRTDLRLVSPDRKQLLLHKYLRDISIALKGVNHSSHFAFISKEPTPENGSNYVGYIFKCDSEAVVEDIVSAIRQAVASDRKSSVLSCESCPMVWYHRLCLEMEAAAGGAGGGGGGGGPEGGGTPRQLEALRRRLEALGPQEAAVVRTKLEGGGGGHSLGTTMMLLRAHCEAKQARHVHDTLEQRHEFLSHYLGNNGLLTKAKRSLTSSFDQLLKRRGSRDDLHHSLSLPKDASLCKDLLTESPNRSSCEADGPEEPGTPGSMKNIFMKLGRTPRTPNSELRPRSWRQSIYNNVVTPIKAMQKDGEPKEPKRDGSYYRNLWRKAIRQQVLLIRMEKENARFKARLEEVTVRRIKLEYEEVGTVAPVELWEGLVQADRGLSLSRQDILAALRTGIPKTRRGESWLWLAEQYDREHPLTVDPAEFPDYHTPYEALLKRLTSHQHAILIDLGRTFPNHPYYSSPLGPGQLSLFNILKAYSLVDPEVGYCQGLSFTAGLLLLHLPESEAFHLLRHLMFSRGLRERYLPDMSALKVCLYQLSRLLHDLHPDLYSHFDLLEVPPSLYAAPWLLTLFSSQFSLGFVARVFDLLLGDSPLVLFKVSIALLGLHKEELLACGSFEEVMDYLKTSLPAVTNTQMDILVKEVLDTDVTRELTDYGVEYHVLEEEMSSPRPEQRRIKELEAANQALTEQVASLQRQLQMAGCDKRRLEMTRTQLMSQLNRSEAEAEQLREEKSRRNERFTSQLSVLAGFAAQLLDSAPPAECSPPQVPTEVIRILKEYNLNLLPRNKGELRAQISCPELKPPPQSAVTTHHHQQQQQASAGSRPASPGRLLSESERLALVRSRKVALERVKKPGAQSSLELGAASRHHPLDSTEVATSFQGTVCLRSLTSGGGGPVPPLRRAETTLPLPDPRASLRTGGTGGDTEKILRRAETMIETSEKKPLSRTDPPYPELQRSNDSKLALRISDEPSDPVAAKIQSTKDRVRSLFDFDKPFGKQTQMLIKSQAPQKPNLETLT